MYDRELLDKLDELRATQWQGQVFRHMFGEYPPERENQRGARWNPSETPAIYTSLTRAVALAEADFQISLQPIRPTARRTIYRIDVALASVIDLSDRTRLAALGISEDDVAFLDHRACQLVGGAIEWLGNGDIEAILQNVTHESMSGSGNATHGFMDLILMMGIAGPEKAAYVDNLDLFHTMEAYFTWYPNGDLR